MFRSRVGKGPVVVAGDMNARIQKITSKGEGRHIGKYAFDKNNTDIHRRGDGVQESRAMMIDFLKRHQFKVKQ